MSYIANSDTHGICLFLRDILLFYLISRWRYLLGTFCIQKILQASPPVESGAHYRPTQTPICFYDNFIAGFISARIHSYCLDSRLFVCPWLKRVRRSKNNSTELSKKVGLKAHNKQFLGQTFFSFGRLRLSNHIPETFRKANPCILSKYQL